MTGKLLSFSLIVATALAAKAQLLELNQKVYGMD